MEGGSSSQESLINSFSSITGVDRERAVFFLQSAAWNLDAAMGTFYDDSASDQSAPTLKDSESDLQVEPTTSQPLSTESSKPLPVKERGGIATLSDYQQKPMPSAGEDPQQFFAGGSEHSGQMIEGPPRKHQTPDSIAKDVFEAAKKYGAVSEEEQEREEQRQSSAAFQGTGFRLGEVEGPSQCIGEQGTSVPKPELLRHVLTFWKDGFSVDDGPLRTGQSEEDKQFIDSVRKGEIPRELMRASREGEVDVDIRDNRNEVYVKPKPKVVAFSGAGRKLGSYAPSVKSSSAPSAPAQPTGCVSTSPQPQAPTVPLDSAEPTTTIQIRLADGTRLVSKFNHSHTINDIRQFINMSRPSSASYVLLTTFPNKELSDPTLTLSQASLLNAVIVQRIR